MKITVALLFILSNASLSASAQQAPTPPELFEAAHKVADLSRLGGYVLEATVIVKPSSKKENKTGHLTISRDKDLTRIELEIGKTHEVRIIEGDRQFVPVGQGVLLVAGLINVDRAWDPTHGKNLSHNLQGQTAEVKKKKIHDVQSWCAETKQESSQNEYCFDGTSSAMLSERFGKSGRTEFQDFTSIQDMVYPRTIKLFKENLSPVELRDITVKPLIADDQTFKVPDDAIELESCKSVQHPKPISTPEPTFPDVARQQRIQGNAFVYAVIGKDGRIRSAEIISPDNYGFAANAGEIVKTWTFQPATCSGRPVNAELSIFFSFRLN